MVLAFLLILAGCVLLYLAHPNQQLLMKPAGIGFKAIGLQCFIFAIIVLTIHFSPGTTVLIVLCTAMFILGVVPFISLLKPGKENGHG